MNQQYLLTNKIAERLYRNVASDLPIIDYHNHLCVEDMISDRKFETITQLWIRVDPYKHRAMRILGVPEKYITGDADDYEVFEKWYGCLPRLIGNPLYDWSEMEFAVVFGMTLDPLSVSAREVWDEANEKLKTLTAKRILEKFRVEYMAPCASLLDDLAKYNQEQRICPSLRADDVVHVNRSLLEKMEVVTGIEMRSLHDFWRAVKIRLNAFAEAGCNYSDHALDDGFVYIADDGKNEERFWKVKEGEELTETDRQSLSSYILRQLGGLYAEKGFTMQLHIGARRSTSTRLGQVAGPAGGYAAIGNCVNVKALTEFLDDVEKQEYGLPKTLLFTLNPADHAVMAVLSGSYSKDGVEAVVSPGPAWWWCDHQQGITDMLEHLSVYGILSTFVGMTTDSRSLLHFVRHDYFRRILCNWIGEKVQKGALPDNEAMLADLVKKMCYSNAAKTIQR